MTLRSFLHLVLLGILLIVGGESVFAGATGITFTPTPSIGLFGQNGKVNFDVKTLFESDPSLLETSPVFNTGTMKFSGAFYSNTLGWIEFATGSYSVGLTCNQVLTGLSEPCTLNGSGYSENAGEIGFSQVKYDPLRGTLSGSADSLLGPISLDGIYFPLRSAHFVGEDNKTISQTGLNLEIVDRASYGSGLWSLQWCPPSDPACGNPPPSSMSGSWMVDASEIGDYLYTITDPQGSKTDGKFTIVEGSIDHEKTVYSGNLVKNLSLPKLKANGKDEYTLEIQFRDKLGNPVTVNGMEFFVQLAGENANVGISMNQLTGSDIPASGPYSYIFGLEKSALNISSLGISGLNSSSVLLGNSFPINNTDIISLTFSSVAPSEELHFEKLGYNYEGVYTNLLDTRFRSEKLPFEPIVTVSPSQPSQILEGSRLSLTGKVNIVLGQEKYVKDVKTIHGVSMGDVNSPNYTDLQTSSSICSVDVGPDISSDLCKFSSLSGVSNPSLVAFAGTGMFPFSWSGTQSGKIVTYTPLITYTLNGADPSDPPIIYYGNSWAKMATLPEPVIPDPVTILGARSLSLDGYTDLNPFFQEMHRTVAELTRNGVPSGANYRVSPSSISVSSGTLNTNTRSIIVKGADITITGNILKNNDHPYALIVLQEEGNGGHIIINTGVTDIHATLIAEQGVLANGEGSGQLYIFGSVLSRNTLSGSRVDPPVCPYFITECTTQSQASPYDLSQLRIYPPDINNLSKTSTTANTIYSGSSLVIEYDNRLIQDPPPGMKR